MANARVPQALLDRIGKAKVSGGGTFINHGHYLFAIKDWKYQNIQSEVIVTEFYVVEAIKIPVMEGAHKVDAEPNPVGSTCSNVVNFDGNGKLSADGEAKAVVLGLFGLEEGKCDDALVSQTLGECLSEAQPARGMLIRCETYPKIVRSRKNEPDGTKGKYIVGRNWICVDKPGEGRNSPEECAKRIVEYKLK